MKLFNGFQVAWNTFGKEGNNGPLFIFFLLVMMVILREKWKGLKLDGM